MRIADNSLRPMRLLRISSLPALVSKRQVPPSLTSGTGNGQSSLPITSTRASARRSSRCQRSATATVNTSRLRRAVAASDESMSWRPSGPKIATTSSRLPALTAAVSARTAASGVANVRYSDLLPHPAPASEAQRSAAAIAGHLRWCRWPYVVLVTVASPIESTAARTAAARAAPALLAALAGGALRSPARIARERVRLRAAAIAARRRGVAAVPARLRRRPRRAAAGGLPVGALLVSALRPLLLPGRPLLARPLRALAAIFAPVLAALAALC